MKTNATTKGKREQSWSRCLMVAMACFVMSAALFTGCSAAVGGSSTGKVSGTSATTTQTKSESAKPASTTQSDTSTTSSQQAGDPFKGPIDSEADAINYIHDCLMRAGKEMSPKIECEGKKNGRYVVHCYEVVDDGAGKHNATWYRYSVDEDGNIYDEILLKSVDPMTME